MTERKRHPGGPGISLYGLRPLRDAEPARHRGERGATDIESALVAIRAEYEIASQVFGPFASPHEGYAIILEELEELKSEIFWGHKSGVRLDNLRKEAKQVAAMALRFMVDLT